MHDIASFIEYLRQRICPLCGTSSATLKICTDTSQETTVAAGLMLVFGVWMLLLGSGFAFAAIFAKTDWAKAIAAKFDFPIHERVATVLFGAAIGSFSLFYFAAGILRIEAFYWMSVFGRLGVFGTCAVMAWWQRDMNKSATPNRLLWAALPDLVFALLTAWYLLPNYLARVTFLGGTLYLVLALGFLTFPRWILSPLSLEIGHGSWTIVLGTLLTFFGAYAIAAALLDYVPIIWASILATLLVLFTVALVLAFQSNETLGAKKKAAKWRLVGLVFGLFTTVLVVAISAARHVPTPPTASVAKAGAGTLVAGAN